MKKNQTNQTQLLHLNCSPPPPGTWGRAGLSAALRDIILTVSSQCLQGSTAAACLIACHCQRKKRFSQSSPSTGSATREWSQTWRDPTQGQTHSCSLGYGSVHTPALGSVLQSAFPSLSSLPSVTALSSTSVVAPSHFSNLSSAIFSSWPTLDSLLTSRFPLRPISFNSKSTCTLHRPSSFLDDLPWLDPNLRNTFHNLLLLS